MQNKSITIKDEKYIRFDKTHFTSEDEVMQELSKMIEEFKALRGYIPRLFSQYLENYKHEIVRSFIVTKVSRRSTKDNECYYARLSNGRNHSTESLKLIRETHEVPLTLIIQEIKFYSLPEIDLH